MDSIILGYKRGSPKRCRENERGPYFLHSSIIDLKSSKSISSLRFSRGQYSQERLQFAVVSIKMCLGKFFSMYACAPNLNNGFGSFLAREVNLVNNFYPTSSN